MTIDWAVVTATLVGPIAAVVITLWYQHLSFHSQNKMQLFSTMMRLRRNPQNTEFVGSLNLVPVHFSRHAKVMDRYAQLMAIFNDNGWKLPDVVPSLVEKVDLGIAYLLSEMSKAVGTPVEQLHVLRGAYAPQGWSDEEQKNKALQEQFRRLLAGETALPVTVIVPTNTIEHPQESMPSDGTAPNARTEVNP